MHLQKIHPGLTCGEFFSLEKQLPADTSTTPVCAGTSAACPVGSKKANCGEIVVKPTHAQWAPKQSIKNGRHAAMHRLVLLLCCFSAANVGAGCQQLLLGCHGRVTAAVRSAGKPLTCHQTVTGYVMSHATGSAPCHACLAIVHACDTRHNVTHVSHNPVSADV